MVRDPTIELWALDEVMFKQHGSTCKMWIAPEVSDPVVFHAPARKSVRYFGAVRIRDGKFVFMREPKVFNAVTFFQFLKLMRRRTARTKKRIVVILDNARYHHAVLHKEWRNERKNYFCLEFLPAYCPDLNAIERIWKLTRKQCIHNRYFPDLDSIIASIDTQFLEWKNGSDIIRRLCAIN